MKGHLLSVDDGICTQNPNIYEASTKYKIIQLPPSRLFFFPPPSSSSSSAGVFPTLFLKLARQIRTRIAIMVNKSLFSVAIGLLAAIATANPVAVSPTDAVDAIATPSPVSRADLPDLGIPEEGLPLPGLVIHSPGYNKTAAAEEGNIEARGYGPTCVGCLLFNTGTDLVLQCTCGKASGGRNTPRYNLNQCVGNSNGQLVWWVK